MNKAANKKAWAISKQISKAIDKGEFVSAGNLLDGVTREYLPLVVSFLISSNDMNLLHEWFSDRSQG